MRHARDTRQSAALHGWRKRLKTFWYQLRLARPLAPAVVPLIASVERLETDLGDDHNLVVLGATLRGCRELPMMPAELRQVERMAARMRRDLRQSAFALGRQLYRQTPKAFGRWLRISSTQRRNQQSGAA